MAPPGVRQAKLSGYVMQADAVAKDQAGNLHAVVASQSCD